MCRDCLAETDVEKLEAQWTLLDELWMSVRHYIQVVHDIEYGYGDPLRTKARPDPDCNGVMRLSLWIRVVGHPPCGSPGSGVNMLCSTC